MACWREKEIIIQQTSADDPTSTRKIKIELKDLVRIADQIQ